MNFDSGFYGAQGLTDEDRSYAGSRFAEVRKTLFKNPYYLVWGGPDEPGLPTYGVTLDRVLKGIWPGGKPWLFRQAARRSVLSAADLRWGPDRLGYRRLLHPNGVCLIGKWMIDQSLPGVEYTGYFKPGSEALLIARYSTCCSETRRGYYRSLSLVGKLYPTTDPDHALPLRTANFITQEDLGGAKSLYIADAKLRNAPNTTPWRRGLGVPILMLTGLVLTLTDKEIAHRQLYEIAELGKPENERTHSPEFMQLTVAPEQKPIEGGALDFRDEILGHIYDKGDPKGKRSLAFNIEVSDEGRTKGVLLQRRFIKNWKPIGRLVFHEAVASYNGDFVLHFHHPPWRNNRNDPLSLARKHDS